MKKAMLSFLAGAVMFAAGSLSVAAQSKTTVSLVFNPTNSGELTDYVYDTVDPASANYHQYLSGDEFANKFGATSTTISSFKNYFKKYKVSATPLSGNLVMKIRGSKTNLNKAFKAKLVKKTNRVDTNLPKSMASKVQSVIGLTSTKSSHKNLFSSDVDTSSEKPNLSFSPTRFSDKYGANKFAKAYQLDKVYNQGATGANQNIGIIMTNASFKNSDVQKFWLQSGVNADTSRIKRVYADDSQKKADTILDQGTGPQTEATLDVDQAGAVAPDAKVTAYIANSVDDNTFGSELFFGAFARAIADNDAKQLSTSFAPNIDITSKWFSGTSETLNQYNDALNLIFQQAAAQGQTIYAASGDFGPWQKPMKQQNHLLAVSPYLTSVGGTTLPYQKLINGKLVTVSKERAWSGLAAISKQGEKAGAFPGGGGGFSNLDPTPRFQVGVPGVNTFRALDYIKYSKGRMVLNKNPHIIFGTGSGRNLPDISGNADKQTGYAVYVSGTNLSVSKGKLKKTPVKEWMVSGGTSFTAPQMAGANAVLNSGLKQNVGFLNPQIYRMAQSTDSPMNVLDDADNNDNLYYTGQPGKLYNQATGLGTVNYQKLYQQLGESK
ncbi:S53 family peptidase [Lentilactobacillus sp. Marseille-Q4993]|uniref:S53 family peptidase n=1 Tax=Lentilactobacillus sp. Marseille-Q4993 TaxID=3039492 RepID=UPI0024BD3453|nr:S53 family peptidase [Lentilactobacillus sp. Marseille-Q4993]